MWKPYKAFYIEKLIPGLICWRSGPGFLFSYLVGKKIEFLISKQDFSFNQG